MRFKSVNSNDFYSYVHEYEQNRKVTVREHDGYIDYIDDHLTLIAFIAEDKSNTTHYFIQGEYK